MRKMRREERQISEQEAWDVLRAGTSGVLSTIGADGWPYGIPMNYAVQEDRILFHCAPEGHKLDNIRYSDNVCFTVVESAEILPEKLTTRYGSVVCFGTIRIVTDPTEKMDALRALVRHLLPEEKEREERWLAAVPRTCILEMKVEEITGKRNGG